MEETPPTDVDEREPSLVPVYAASRVDADLIRSLLEGSGIRAFVLDERSAAYPVSVGALGETRVVVRRQDEERARGVIGEAMEGHLTMAEEEIEPAGRSRIMWVFAALVALGLVFAIVAGEFRWY